MNCPKCGCKLKLVYCWGGWYSHLAWFCPIHDYIKEHIEKKEKKKENV